MEVHRHLGSGFLEQVYHEALARELDATGVPYQREHGLRVHYKGRPLASTYRADFVCYDTVIVEIKAIEQVTRVEQARVINYLRASGFERGMLLNFGQSSLQHRRLILSDHEQSGKPS